MRKLIENLSKEEIIDFLEEYAANDAKFANAVNVRFGAPVFEKELGKIEKVIKKTLSGASDYRRRGDWGYIDVDTSDITAEIEQRAEQGHIKLAFAETETLYRKLIEVFEYQEECEISDEVEDCLRMMDWIAGKAVLGEDKDYIFERCIGLSDLDTAKDYGADYEDKLLKIAAKFVTEENRIELEKALALFESDWRAEEFQLIRLEIIRRIEGEDAANNFITENLRFPKIREIAFEISISSKNYLEAERLCSNALTAHEYRRGISPWLYKLYTVYEMSGNMAEMSATAEKILLCGDLEYYDKLKTLLAKQALWDSSYPELLVKCKSKLPHTGYMEILAKEKEYSMLMEQMNEHTKQIYQYGKLLAEKYPTEIEAIFTGQINEEARAAHDRKTYQFVCSHISFFAEAGYKTQATQVVSNLKSEYKRKPAFVDELNKTKI